MTPAEQEEYLSRLELIVERGERVAGIRGGNGNVSMINLNAGGVAMWVALLIAAFLAGINISQINIIGQLQKAQSDQKAEIRELNAYLNVIYQYAPQLRPKKKEKENGA